MMAVAASESIWVSTEGPGALLYPTTFAFPPLGMPSSLPHLLQSSIPSPIGANGITSPGIWSGEIEGSTAPNAGCAAAEAEVASS